jgi:polyisoprenoid-binding protein YceI
MPTRPSNGTARAGAALLVLGAAQLLGPSFAAPSTTAEAPQETAQQAIPSGQYSLDKAHGFLMFTYLHQGYSHPILGFDAFDVRLTYNAEHPQKSTVFVNINPDSVDAGTEIFHEHLTSSRWFDVLKYPEIRVVSTGISHLQGDKWRLDGNLTIKGITKPVTLDVTMNRAGNNWWTNVPMIGFSARTTIKRSNWGMGEYVPQISDDVEVMIEIELQKDKVAK